MPLTAAEVLALGLEQMKTVETLRVELEGKFQKGDVASLFRLVSQVDLPDKAHGTFEIFGEQQGFLRLGDEEYIAKGRLGISRNRALTYRFEAVDYNQTGGGVFLDLLKPLLKPGVADEQLTELDRQPDETIDGGSSTTSPSAWTCGSSLRS